MMVFGELLYPLPCPPWHLQCVFLLLLFPVFLKVRLVTAAIRNEIVIITETRGPVSPPNLAQRETLPAKCPNRPCPARNLISRFLHHAPGLSPIESHPVVLEPVVPTHALTPLTARLCNGHGVKQHIRTSAKSKSPSSSSRSSMV